MLELVDRLIVIDQGRVVADGPKAQVLQALSKSSAEAAAAKAKGSTPGDPSA
jgi:ATP-binding cassette subfamily C protein LapB